ncbi:chromate efflux transporter [Azoarcus indigens]|uniref:Chromate transporter n=1 Tax=Azoarcus indigens TaxID=29545 RepID=A0A4R6E101_9RHOO|nr:chromate efflux transporter [Azoarcus indigens]NMG66202.1 chromate efflux transporter [Azoarcus indigens]TDN51333.1 chromate transporter [Azoarcus indigens]
MPPPARTQDSMGRIFLLFLRLGLTSFGGPVAHLGYFRTEFVDRRRWLDDRSYAELLALCQFLPGPASSQVGMALGLGRAGLGGALAAWAGFTLPSALALILFAYGLTEYRSLADAGWVHGLKVVAVAVVAQAVWGMAKTLCPDRPRVALALLAALLTLLLPSAWTQLAAIAATGLAGRWWLRLALPAAAHPAPHAVSSRLGVTALGVLVLLLLGLPLWASASASSSAALIDGVFRAGALVFGGGHVVLPLLQSATAAAGVVGNADFLAGYGAAQAVPGPLFSFAAFLGAVADWPLQGWRGGLVLLAVIFLPALLVLLAALPFWERLRRRRHVQAALAGINAGVVGILLAALYDPVWTSAIHTRTDFALALACFGLLVPGRVPPVAVVGLAALAGQIAA